MGTDAARPPAGEPLPAGVVLASLDPDRRARLARRLRAAFDAGTAIGDLADVTGLALPDVWALLDEGRPDAPAVPGDLTALGDLVDRGVVDEPASVKRRPRPPIVAAGGLSDIVLAQRG